MQFFVVLEKFTCAYLFQIALEIIRLPIQNERQQRTCNTTQQQATKVSRSRVTRVTCPCFGANR